MRTLTCNTTVDAGAYLAACGALDKQRQLLSHSILQALRGSTPGWQKVQQEDITLKHLGGAMTNLIFAVSKTPFTGENDEVLVRIYGEGTESFFSREDETHLFRLLSSRNIGIELLGQFANGRAEKLIKGDTCTAQDIHDPQVSSRIATKMRLFHELDIEISHEPRLLPEIHRLLQVARQKCAGHSAIEEAVDFVGVEQSIVELENILDRCESKTVLCHNDLQYGNIMHTVNRDNVTLIDFEYCSYNPRGYDIGNHFCEWAYNYHREVDPHLGDFSKYPNVQEQRNFCRAYLRAGAKEDPLNSPRSALELAMEDKEVEQLRHEANTYSLASHLFWTLWGLIQATQSEIEFDFLGYALCRYEAFKQKKTLQD